MNKIAILSRYKETNTEWVDFLHRQHYDSVIFNKYGEDNLLPNVGREGHTYIYYIINNYYNLPDEILFSQYDPRDHFRHMKIYNSIENNMLYFVNSYLYDFIGIRPTNYDLIVRKRKIAWRKLAESLFQEYSYELFSKIVSTGSSLNGIFRVTREAILKYDINFYIRALNMLNYHVDPDEGYFFERIWRFLFTDYGSIDNGRYHIFKNRIFLFGSPNNLVRSHSKNLKDNNYGHIKLSEDGTITNNSNVSYYSHYNESFWTIKKDYLYILSQDGCITSKYNLSNIFDIDHQIIIGDKYTHEKIEPNYFWLKPLLYQDELYS